jgi:hypothetical protein
LRCHWTTVAGLTNIIVSMTCGHCCREYRRANFSLANAYESPAPVAHPKPAAGASLLAASRRPIHRTRSNITTLRSLSALMIFSFGGLSPVSTMLIIEGATPLFLAHSFWPPARLTSERSKRTTSFWSSARMSVFRTAASCVDGPQLARVIFVRSAGRLQSCVRPFGAVAHDRWP